MTRMMRWSCSRGCCVRDGRAGEKRDWQRWPGEYAETLDEQLTDWCPHDLRVCPNDTRLCCRGEFR